MDQQIVLIDKIPPEHRDSFEQLNTDILWGWKRDVGKQNRLVYFSANMRMVGDAVTLERIFFYYRTIMSVGRGGKIAAALSRAADLFLEQSMAVWTRQVTRGNQNTIEFSLGNPTAADLDRSHRLKLRRPRPRLLGPEFPPASPIVSQTDILPADLYIGSGVSYEAGLPTLCDMHDVFGVDNHIKGSFTVGEEDLLPALLANEGIERIKLFCSVHTKALTAQPTAAMIKIAELQQAGLIRKIFTDNVDNMLCKVNAKFERVRGSGVFNERYEAEFETNTLIVVGVAADRRQIIKQARQRGMRIVVVNPLKKVSPNVTHLDYLRRTDQFYKCEAQTFFSTVVGDPASKARTAKIIQPVGQPVPQHGPSVVSQAAP